MSHMTKGSTIDIYRYITEIPVAQRIDDTDPNVIYLGWAAPGMSDNDPGWRIKKITPTAITWADGDTYDDNIWANRASLTYL